MKTIFLTLFLSVILLAASAHALVTQAQIDAQTAVVLTAQTQLDSLYSLQLAEDWQSRIDADSLLLANGTATRVAEKVAGIFDPRFIALDVNFAGWSVPQQSLWNLGVQLYGKHVATGISGRYNVRRDNVEGFLGYLKTFLGQF